MPGIMMKRGSSLRRCVAGTLCALLLWPGSSCALAAAKPLTAILLIARRELSDPFFAKSVVLVMNDLGPAPIGLIINKPTSIRVSALFPGIKRLAHAGGTVYFGGPVEIGSVWFLFRAQGAFPHAVQVLHGVYLSGDPGLLLRLLHRQRPMQGLRIYAGHAGWAPGQLQSEIRMGFWTAKQAHAQVIFSGGSGSSRPAPRAPRRGAVPTSTRLSGTTLQVRRL
jgi:putative transcriptional regulator